MESAGDVCSDAGARRLDHLTCCLKVTQKHESLLTMIMLQSYSMLVQEQESCYTMQRLRTTPYNSQS